MALMWTFDVSVGQFLTCALVFLIAFFTLRRRRHGRLPPGPISLPIIGSMLSLRGGDRRDQMLRLRDKYGDIFTIGLGPQRTIVLASYDVIKDALVKNWHLFSDRPTNSFIYQELAKNGLGILSANGTRWKAQRKFAHSVFREFGVGRPVFEGKIHEEISHLLEIPGGSVHGDTILHDETETFMQVLAEKSGRAFDPQLLLQMTVSNVINNFTFGSRYDYNDPRFVKYIEDMNKNSPTIGVIGILSAVPFLKHLPGDLFHYKRLMAARDYMLEGFRESIQKAKHTLQANGLPNDFITAYLQKMSEESDNENTTFTEEQLEVVIANLFAAGTETTTTALRWALIYLLRNPEIQTRVHQEIDQVLGTRTPSMKDRSSMPYTEAVLLEVLRMGDIVPMGVPRGVTQDIEFQGYTIPAGSTVMTLMHAVHRDPTLWKDPYTFNPQRHLDENGLINKSERIIPFSMGKRVCLGESLARMELFLFFTAIMQKMRFQIPPGESAPSEESLIGINNAPVPFQVVLEPRGTAALVPKHINRDTCG